MADGPLPEAFVVDELARSFGCRPSEVRQEDELDLELRKLWLRVKRQVDAAKAYAER